MGFAVRHPLEAAQGTYNHVTTPSRWFSGIRTAYANGDFYGLGLHGGSLIAETAAGTAAIRLIPGRAGVAAETMGPHIIGVDARTLARSHSIEGSRSIRTVDQMSDIMRNDGYAFDPIDVIQHDGAMIIVDGHHRAAAAMLTNTPVNVRVVGSDQFPMGSGGWQSIEEVILGSHTAGPNRLNPPWRRR